MSRHVAALVCQTCASNLSSRIAPLAGPSSKRLISTSPKSRRRFASGRDSGGSVGSSRSDAGGGFRPRSGQRDSNTFKLSSDIRITESKDAERGDILQQLRSRARELSQGKDSSQMVAIIDALAKRLGMDVNEVESLAKVWADTKPFSADLELKGTGKGKAKATSDHSFDISAIQTDLGISGPRAIDRAILSSFLSWLRAKASDGDVDVSPQLAAVVELLDLRWPTEWYPAARGVRRKLVLHVGPTNSGKTYNALCALAKARTGAFAGPLRLLATEVYNRFHGGTIGGLTPDKPRLCNLITGEERRIHDPMCGLESCTVEMLSHTKLYDVVVIDEIQMMGDPHRGTAWTHALLGVKANEIHLCGEPSVVDLIQRIGKACGDEVIVNRYERLSPLVVADHGLDNDLTKVRRGDCVVTFSRSNIFALKAEIEKKTGLRVAVAYGGLPPEVREEQARGFNSAGDPTGYDVMVASDAIGMGLNLKIKRVIFETLSKYDGQQEVDLSVSQIKQIGGRAGRYGVQTPSSSPSSPDEDGTTVDDVENFPGSDSSAGIVTCLHEKDMLLLRKAMKAPMLPIDKAALHPLTPQLEGFSALIPKSTTQSQVFDIYPVLASASRDYYIPPFGGTLKLTNLLKHLSTLTVSEQWLLGNSPVNTRDPLCVNAFVEWATAYSHGNATRITHFIENERFHDMLQNFRDAEDEFNAARAAAPDTDVTSSPLAQDFSSITNLSALESLHRCLGLYLWLGNRFGMHYPQIAEARLFKIEVQDAIDFILRQLKFDRLETRKKHSRDTQAKRASFESQTQQTL